MHKSDTFSAKKLGGGLYLVEPGPVEPENLKKVPNEICY